MVNRQFRAYAWIVSLAAAASLPLLDWARLGDLTPRVWVLGWGFLMLFGLVSEHLALRITIGKGGSTSSSITFILIFACVALFGPAATVLFAGVSWAVSQFVVRRKEFPKALFNVSQIVLSTTIAGWLFVRLGGVWDPYSLNIVPLAFVAFGGVFVVANLLLVSGAVRALEGVPFLEVVNSMAGPKGSHLAYDFLVSPVAFLVAILYVEFEIWGLFGAAMTLFFIRRSYLTNFQLQQALNDLLKVLVKAIETRDPYTSGHSMRVSSLGGRIGMGMGLPAKKIEEVETAALLHDIGKIDEIYNDILKKPGSLSAEEREVIESHATKGAELLQSLSSVSDEIIASVRHHHERVDGKGYPDRISGKEIPLGARIIKVCDAIDAMLSDRPYRKALKISEVKEQLVTYAGIQFDVEVVSACLQENILEEHATELSLRRLREAEPEPLSRAKPLDRGRAQSTRTASG
jgi:putative nucleotidyltransferase with HDIG domain